MAQFERPTGSFNGSSGANRTKYQDDSAAVPKRAISSSKVDGDLNYILDALNTIWGLNATGAYTDLQAAVSQIRQNQLDISSLVTTGFITPSGTNVVAYSANGTDWTSGKVTNSLLRDSAGLSVIGRSANTTGAVADITAGTDGHILRRSGSTVAFGTVPATSITFSNAASGMTATNVQAALDEIDGRFVVSATSRILGRKSASAGDMEECTLSDILDFIGSAAQGDILYRGASGWARLGAGTSGHFLKTNGPAANPSWAISGVVIQSLRSGTQTRTDVGSTLIPLDNTIPQNTEGTQILSQAITPTNSSNRIRVTVNVQTSGNFNAVNVALFKDSGADAVACGNMNANPSSQGGATVVFDYEEIAGSTSARTFYVRAGGTNNAGGAGGVINGMSSGVSSGATMGGKFSSSILVEELTP